MIPILLYPPFPSVYRNNGDYVIDESEAMDVEDCFIAQETIDDLIQNFDNEPPEKPAEPDFFK